MRPSSSTGHSLAVYETEIDVVPVWVRNRGRLLAIRGAWFATVETRLGDVWKELLKEFAVVTRQSRRVTEQFK